MTARTVVAAMAGCLAWYLHARHVPWPATGTVPVLDMIELRNPGAYLLLKVWWFLAPLATVTTLAAAAMSAWTVWGPGARMGVPRRGSLPADPFDPSSEEISLTVGELHHPTEPVESESPSWLSIPARGLFTGVCIVGAVGSGKTSACMHPFGEQLLGWQAKDPERRAAALVLEVKGDFCFAVRDMLGAAGRGDDYRELSLAGEWAWNPLNEPEIDSYSLAYSVGSLLNQLFGKGKEPFWQQAYTNLVRFTIELHRLEEQPWFTLQDIYRLAIAGDRFLARIEEAGQRIPPEWAAGAEAEATPVERARIEAGELASKLGELARWEWVDASGGGYETAASAADFEELERILGHPPRRIVPAELVLGTSGPSVQERRERRLRFEAVQRWFVDDWAQLDQKLRTSIVEGISSFLSLFDEPGVADAFCPPRPGTERPGARRLLPPMEELIESGAVLALNMPAGANPALARVVGVMLKQSWLQALLRRPRAMGDPANADRFWRPAVFLCDEYHSFATTGGDDPGGDERAFALSRQSRCVPVVATQSLSSLRSATHGTEAWRTLLQTLRTKVFLSLSDDFSAEQASKMCGQAEVLKPNYSFSESASRAGVSLLTARAGGSRGSLSASRSYSPRLEAKFKQRDFAELDNAQAIVVPYDGVRTLPATRCYLKPHYLPRDRSYFRQREGGEL